MNAHRQKSEARMLRRNGQTRSSGRGCCIVLLSDQAIVSILEQLFTIDNVRRLVNAEQFPFNHLTRSRRE